MTSLEVRKLERVIGAVDTVWRGIEFAGL